MYDADGYVVQLDEQRRRQLLDVVDDMAARGLRCICLAARDLPPDWGQGAGGQQEKEAPADDMVVQVRACLGGFAAYCGVRKCGERCRLGLPVQGTVQGSRGARGSDVIASRHWLP